MVRVGLRRALGSISPTTSPDSSRSEKGATSVAGAWLHAGPRHSFRTLRRAHRQSVNHSAGRRPAGRPHRHVRQLPGHRPLGRSTCLVVPAGRADPLRTVCRPVPRNHEPAYQMGQTWKEGAGRRLWSVWRAHGNDEATSGYDNADAHRCQRPISDVVKDSTITCPNCGATSREEMPQTSCLIVWDCPDCNAVARPVEGDCCVYCSYGDVPCPPLQMSGRGRPRAC